MNEEEEKLITVEFGKNAGWRNGEGIGQYRE